MKRTDNAGSAEKKKSNIRFGAADVVIILLVLISVASVVIRSVSDNSSFRSKTDECRLEFVATEVRYTTFDYLEPETDVYIGNELVGRLAAQPTFSPSVLHTAGADGAPIDVHYPENTFIDISGAVSCSLVPTEGGYLTPAGVHLAPGSVITLRLRTVDITVTVTSLTKVDAVK